VYDSVLQYPKVFRSLRRSFFFRILDFEFRVSGFAGDFGIA